MQNTGSISIGQILLGLAVAAMAIIPAMPMGAAIERGEEIPVVMAAIAGALTLVATILIVRGLKAKPTGQTFDYEVAPGLYRKGGDGGIFLVGVVVVFAVLAMGVLTAAIYLNGMVG